MPDDTQPAEHPDAWARVEPRRIPYTGLLIAAFVGLGVWLFGGMLSFSERPHTSAAEGAGSEVHPDAIPADLAPPAQQAGSAAGSGATVPDAAAPARAAGSETSVDAGNAAVVGREWAARHSALTGIPLRALVGYAGAELAMQREAPGCGIRWTTLAAIGNVESGHGTHAGSAIGNDGVTRPAILGPDLDGTVYDRIDDTDGGAFDGSAVTDRAVGPMQFIPSTWAEWGADGNRDGIADPQQIDDAALATARYLCHTGDLTDPATWRAAVFSYNHVESYVNGVAETANEYARRSRG